MENNQEKQVQDIKKTIVFNAPIQKVWDAVSTAEGIESWFMPNNFQAKLGYEFYLKSPYETSQCKVLELNPPFKLAFSWGTFGWYVVFELKDLDGKTEFTLIHSGWGEADEVLPQANQESSKVRDRMNNGWDGLVYKSLKKVVEQ